MNKTRFQKLQSELNNIQKNPKCYPKTHWLSRLQAITTLYDSLESILTYYRETPIGIEDDIGQ
jgi:hypothetical protein